MYPQQPVPRAGIGDGAPPGPIPVATQPAWRPPEGTPPWIPGAPAPAPTTWASSIPQAPAPPATRVAPSPQAPGPIAAVAVTAPSRRRPTASSVALLASLLVATAGVSFAVGRLTSPDQTSSRGGSAALTSVATSAGAGVTGRGDAPAGVATLDLAPRATEDPDTVPLDRSAAGDLPALSSDDTDGTRAGLPGLSSGAGTLAVDPAGERPAGLGGPQGLGGLQGRVTASDDGLLTIETSDGQALSVTIDASTTFVRQTGIDASAVDVGDEVSVRPAGGGFDGGRGNAAGGIAGGTGDASTSGAIVAGLVTVLESDGG